MKGFISGGLLSLLMLLCANELFAAAVVTVAFLVAGSVVVLLDHAEKRARK